MREDRDLQLRIGSFQRPRDSVTLDQLCHFGANHVSPKELSGRRVENGLDKALGFAQCDCFAITDEWEFTDLYLSSRFLRFCLRHADARDLRPAIGAAGDLRRVERMNS